MTPRALWDLRGACLLQLMSMGLFSTFEAVHMAECGLRPGTIGALLALENALFIVFSPIWGTLADRTGRYRRLIMTGTVGCALNLVVFAYADSGPDFIVYAVIRGIFAPGIQSLMPTLAISVVGPNRPGSGFGRYRAFGSIGFMLGTGLLPLLFGDIATTCLAGSLLLLSSIAFVRRIPRTSGHTPTSLDKPAPLNRGLLLLFFLSYFLSILTEPGIHGFFGAYARELGADVTTVGLLASMTGLMALIGLPVMGAWIDRVGASRMLLLAFSCQVIRMFVIAFISHEEWLWSAHLLHFIAWPGREIGVVVLLSALVPPANRGRLFAILASVRMGGAMVGSFLMGQLVDAFGYREMYLVIGAIAAPGILVFLLFMRKRSKGTANDPGNTLNKGFDLV